MKDLRESINDDIPYYFGNLAIKFGFGFLKINNIKTALVKDEFALIISVDRFYIVIEYVYRNSDGNLVKLCCDSFFAEKYDDEDRQNLIQAGNAKDKILNEITISRFGLKNKWSEMLEGNKEWIEDFSKSRWFSIVKLADDEKKSLEEVIV